MRWKDKMSNQELWILDVYEQMNLTIIHHMGKWIRHMLKISNNIFTKQFFGLTKTTPYRKFHSSFTGQVCFVAC